LDSFGPLPEGSDLRVAIDPIYLAKDVPEQFLHKLCLDRMTDLFSKGKTAGFEFLIQSAWRKAPKDAIVLCNEYKNAGKPELDCSPEQAEKTIALNGGEHETGLCFDLGGPKPLTADPADAQDINKDKAFLWLQENAHLSGITPMIVQPWHWECIIPRGNFFNGEEFTSTYGVRIAEQRPDVQKLTTDPDFGNIEPASPADIAEPVALKLDEKASAGTPVDPAVKGEEEGVDGEIEGEEEKGKTEESTDKIAQEEVVEGDVKKKEEEAVDAAAAADTADPTKAVEETEKAEEAAAAVDVKQEEDKAAIDGEKPVDAAADAEADAAVDGEADAAVDAVDPEAPVDAAAEGETTPPTAANIEAATVETDKVKDEATLADEKLENETKELDNKAQADKAKARGASKGVAAPAVKKF
jgi:hypothetical protein